MQYTIHTHRKPTITYWQQVIHGLVQAKIQKLHLPAR